MSDRFSRVGLNKTRCREIGMRVFMWNLNFLFQWRIIL